MKVVILTEGTRNTGYGHLTRCLSIYQAFEEKVITPIFIAHCDARGVEILSDVHLFCFNWLDEQKRLFELVDGSDLLIIDSYLAPAVVYVDLSLRVVRSVYMDDFLRIDYPKGVIINGTIGAENYYKHCISLPMYPTLTEEEQGFVIEKVLNFYHD